MYKEQIVSHNSVPFKLNEFSYSVVGKIQYRHSHFLAYCKSGDMWITYDDMANEFTYDAQSADIPAIICVCRII